MNFFLKRVIKVSSALKRAVMEESLGGVLFVLIIVINQLTRSCVRGQLKKYQKRSAIGCLVRDGFIRRGLRLVGVKNN